MYEGEINVYPVISTNSAGAERNEYLQGENVSVKAEGLSPNMNCTIWKKLFQFSVLLCGEKSYLTIAQKQPQLTGSGSFFLSFILPIAVLVLKTYYQ